MQGVGGSSPLVFTKKDCTGSLFLLFTIAKCANWKNTILFKFVFQLPMNIINVFIVIIYESDFIFSFFYEL